MKLTKYGHACLELNNDGQLLIVDPGSYTEPMTGRRNVQAVVITHMHDDHCFEEQLDRIAADNVDLQIYGTDEVCTRLAKSRPQLSATAVHHGDFYEVGNFTLEFIGDMHAEIHSSIPLIQNCGVLINGKLYYPGDSFTRPDRAIEILACPSSAPWAKIADIIDFVREVQPRRSFATHNIHLSAEGHQMYNGRIKQFTEEFGGTFEFLDIGDSTEF